MARIETVRGPIPPEDAGITLPHEHLLVNITNWLMSPSEASKIPPAFLEAPVSIEILGELRRNPLCNKDNLVLSDERLAVEEVMKFKQWGGMTIVDVTVLGIGRDPLALKRISEETGLNIITTTGWYTETSHPPIVKKKSVEELKEIMVKEFAEGIGETGIKPGMIGEIGCSYPYHSEEEKVLRAASRAQAETGAGMNIHPGQWDLDNKAIAKDAMTQLDIVEREGGDLNKVYLDHGDFTCFDLDYHRKLLDRGIYLSYDNWGFGEFWVDSYWPGAGTPSDRERIRAVLELCQEGYDKQLLFSQDRCLKMLLVKYGGYGYAHILKNIVPELKFKGVSDKQLRNILVENPKNVLGF